MRSTAFNLRNYSDEVRGSNVKRKNGDQQPLAVPKKPRKDLESQVTESVASFGHEQVKCNKSRKRWCRRCGTIETCRWRTSPAGSQTYVTVMT